ncbi:MAG: hypothetical protein ACJAYB_000681 [Psychromonas sp.]
MLYKEKKNPAKEGWITINKGWESAKFGTKAGEQ